MRKVLRLLGIYVGIPIYTVFMLMGCHGFYLEQKYPRSTTEQQSRSGYQGPRYQFRVLPMNVEPIEDNNPNYVYWKVLGPTPSNDLMRPSIVWVRVRRDVEHY